MSNVLGSLVVELSANSAKFVDDMGKAAYAAKQTAREIDKSFSSLGRIASQTWAPFAALNPIVSQLSFIVAQTGHAASEAMGSFGKFNSAIGATAALGAGAAAALTAVAAGAITMAVKTASSAAEVYKLSQSTGVSTEALSGFNFVAKQVGVSTESMTRGLERMSKSAFTAATAPAGTVTAYTRLGISIRDAAGQIRPTEAIFADIAAKFADMPDGVTKTALAIQLFGRSGADLIPVLNLGREGVQQILDTAQKLGIVLDTQTTQAAAHFEMELGKLKAASEGLQLKLMRDLLPALQTIAAAFAEGRADQNSGMAQLVSGIGTLTKAILGIGQTWFTVLSEVGRFLAAWATYAIELYTAVGRVAERAVRFDFRGAEAEAKEGFVRIKGILDQFLADSRKAWADNRAFIEGMDFGRLGAVTGAPASFWKKTGGADTSAKEPSSGLLRSIQERIAKLEAEAAAALHAASAIGQSAAAMILENAQKEASVLIADLHARAVDKEGKPIKALNDLIEESAMAIEDAEVIKASAAAATQYGKRAADEAEKLMEQSAALDALAEAYAKGGDAVEAAHIQEKLITDSKALATLNELFAALRDRLGEDAPEVEQFARVIEGATAAINKKAAALKAVDLSTYNRELKQAADTLGRELPYLEQLNAAYLQNADAVRAAQVQLKVFQFEQAHPGITPPQIAEITALYRQQSDVAYQGTLKQEAARLDLFGSYEEEITKLNRVREVLQEYGRSTIAVDAAIYDANLRLIEQWDAMVLKLPTAALGDKFHALFNEIVLEGQKAGENIFAALKTAIDDISTQLAKFVTTGKANFKQLFQSLEESIVKASFQKLIGDITAKVTGGIFGVAAGKPDGSELKPFYVIPIGAGGLLGAAPTAGAPAAGGIIGLLKSIFGLGGSSAGAAGKGAEAIGVAGKATETTQLAALGTAATATTTALASLTGGVTSTTVAAGALTPEFASMTATMAPLTAAAESTTATMTALTAAAEAAAIALETVAASGGGGGGGFISSLFGGGEGGGFDLSGLGGFAQHGADVAPGKAYVVGEKRPEIFISKVAGRILPSVPAGIAALAKIGQSPGQSAGRPFMATPAAAVIAALLLTAPAAGLAAGPSGLASAPPAALSSILRSSSSSSTLIKILERQGRAAGGEVAAGATYLTGERRPEVFMPEARGFSPGAMSGTAALPKMGSLGLNFGGFRQMGGDVSPGMAYVTGEQHPEIFIPDQPARPEASGEASQSHQTVINMGGFHVHGVTDFDSFRKSQSQIMAEFYRAAAIAHSRNR